MRIKKRTEKKRIDLQEKLKREREVTEQAVQKITATKTNYKKKSSCTIKYDHLPGFSSSTQH